jgi:DNA-directed RNA polymerase specialized sigma24 family protein
MQTIVPRTKNRVRKSHPLERDVINVVAARAEQEAGYTPRKVGWLAWFGMIVRKDSDLLKRLREIAKTWPPFEREIFEFYFVDRLPLADIALLSGCTARAFHAHLCFIQHRLREALIQEVLTESKSLLVDNWTLRLKCSPCGTSHGRSAISVMDHA